MYLDDNGLLSWSLPDHLVRKFALRLAFIDGVSSTCTVSQWLHGGEDGFYVITSDCAGLSLIQRLLYYCCSASSCVVCYTLLSFASLGLVSTWDAVICRHHIRDGSMNSNHVRPDYRVSWFHLWQYVLMCPWSKQLWEWPQWSKVGLRGGELKVRKPAQCRTTMPQHGVKQCKTNAKHCWLIMILYMLYNFDTLWCWRNSADFCCFRTVETIETCQAD